MASALPDEIPGNVVLLSEDELRELVRWWLTRLECTYAELEAMWRTGDYETHFHRMAWVEIGGLGHLAEG